MRITDNVPVVAFEPPDADPRQRRRGRLLLAFALLPALTAVWLVPGFTTQDGPSHLYNANVILQSLRGVEPYASIYQVRWQPLPNWVGHLSLVGLLAAAPAWAADKVMASVTLVGFAAALLYLRRTVAGDRGLPTAALFAALLALNFPWLMGFSSFLIGTSVGMATLAVWWSGRDRLSKRRVAVLAVLLVLGYFCHLISLGLTVVALVILAALTPGPNLAARRWATLIALAPLAPLAGVYLSLMRGGGGRIAPLWMELRDPFSLDSWRSQLGWVDPLSLAGKLVLPFSNRAWPGFVLFAPIVLFALALAVLAGASITTSSGTLRLRRGWAAIALLFVIGGLIGPDTLGETHGNFMAVRIFLVGLTALVPLLDLGGGGLLGRLAALFLLVAVAVQSTHVWDYAIQADRQTTAFRQARDRIGHGRRIASLLLDLRQKFRANPLLHADNLLGVGSGSGNVIWSNYETAFYYFPVQVRPGVPHPPPLRFEEISLMDDPAFADRRANAWRDLLATHQNEIDILVVWGDDDPRLAPINALWFTLESTWGNLRVFRRAP